jgi:hypothetical protein
MEDISSLQGKLKELFTLLDGRLDQAIHDMLFVFLYGEVMVRAMDY